jgi:phenylacetate-CoA ligase
MLTYSIIDVLRKTDVVKEYATIKYEISQGYDFLQNNKRKKLAKLITSMQYHPFYKNYIDGFDTNIINNDPEKILSSLPIISKEQISSYNNWYTSTDANKKYEQRYTGGSTGAPFNYYLSKYSISRITAFNYYLWNFFLGYKVGDKILAIGGNSLGQNSSFKSKVYNYLQRKEFISGDVINENTLNSALKSILESDYKIIYAYPSSLEFFVDEAIRRNYVFKKRIKGIVTTSEMLSDEALNKIKIFFKCDVLNCYGARDGGVIGCELKSVENGFYYNFYDCIAESITVDEGLGKSELVLTNLNNEAFPMVRYRVGDIGSIENYEPSFKLPLDKLTQLQGRTRDLIYTHAHKVIHGSAFNVIFKNVSSIEQYQIIQNADYNISVIIKSKTSEIAKDVIIDLIRQLLNDPAIEIEVLHNQDFLQSQGQKHKIIVSYVS